jgi:hypothetical protein
VQYSNHFRSLDPNADCELPAEHADLTSGKQPHRVRPGRAPGFVVTLDRHKKKADK